MNLAGAPEMSPRHYETLLPYAIALDVEKPWSRTFEKWLTAALAAGAATAAAYHGPSWYHGRGGFAVDDIGRTMGSLAHDMSNSFTASLPTPKSSSSGFSGGGGGGVAGGSSRPHLSRNSLSALTSPLPSPTQHNEEPHDEPIH